MNNEVIFDSDDDSPVSANNVDQQHVVPYAPPPPSAAENNSSSSTSGTSRAVTDVKAAQQAGAHVPPQSAAADNNTNEAAETALLPHEIVPMEVEEQLPAANANLVAGSGFFPKFIVGELVDVKHRPRKGKDKEGGRARIEGVHPVSIDDPSLGFQYDVKFVVFRKREYRIDEYDILPVDERREADRSRHTLGRCKYVTCLLKYICSR